MPPTARPAAKSLPLAPAADGYVAVAGHPSSACKGVRMRGPVWENAQRLRRDHEMLTGRVPIDCTITCRGGDLYVEPGVVLRQMISRFCSSLKKGASSIIAIAGSITSGQVIRSDPNIIRLSNPASIAIHDRAHHARAITMQSRSFVLHERREPFARLAQIRQRCFIFTHRSTFV
jgi:hypothetical protein